MFYTNSTIPTIPTPHKACPWQTTSLPNKPFKGSLITARRVINFPTYFIIPINLYKTILSHLGWQQSKLCSVYGFPSQPLITTHVLPKKEDEDLSPAQPSPPQILPTLHHRHSKHPTCSMCFSPGTDLLSNNISSIFQMCYLKGQKTSLEAYPTHSSQMCAHHIIQREFLFLRALQLLCQKLFIGKW